VIPNFPSLKRLEIMDYRWVFIDFKTLPKLSYLSLVLCKLTQIVKLDNIEGATSTDTESVLDDSFTQLCISSPLNLLSVNGCHGFDMILSYPIAHFTVKKHHFTVKKGAIRIQKAFE
jgi:hypothetical protein